MQTFHAAGRDLYSDNAATRRGAAAWHFHVPEKASRWFYIDAGHGKENKKQGERFQQRSRNRWDTDEAQRDKVESRLAPELGEEGFCTNTPILHQTQEEAKGRETGSVWSLLINLIKQNVFLPFAKEECSRKWKMCSLSPAKLGLDMGT